MCDLRTRDPHGDIGSKVLNKYKKLGEIVERESSEMARPKYKVASDLCADCGAIGLSRFLFTKIIKYSIFNLLNFESCLSTKFRNHFYFRFDYCDRTGMGISQQSYSTV